MAEGVFGVAVAAGTHGGEDSGGKGELKTDFGFRRRIEPAKYAKCAKGGERDYGLLTAGRLVGAGGRKLARTDVRGYAGGAFLAAGGKVSALFGKFSRSFFCHRQAETMITCHRL